MSFLSKLGKKIEDQEWNHVVFLRNLLIILGIVILFFYFWVLILNLNGIVTPEYFSNTVLIMIRGHAIGIGSGVVVTFFILLPYYLKQEWDLHIVVPHSLLTHLALSVAFLGFTVFTSVFDQIFESSLLSGYLLGGLIPILAYSGEVKKEHQEDESGSTNQLNSQKR